MIVGNASAIHLPGGDTKTLRSLDRKVQQADFLRDELYVFYGSALDKPLQPVQPTQAAFHQAVQDVLKAAGLKFDRIDQQKVKPIKKIPETVLVPVHIRGKCKITQFANFLAKVSQAELLMMVDRFHITSNAKKELEIDIVLATLAKREVPS